MASEKEALRDWHRLFGMLLTDFFTDSPFIVEMERDLSQQQQFLDVLVVRRGPGRMIVRLPDGLADLAAHNLITFKSHREALDDWAMKELLGHYVAYRKLVSPSPSELLPEDQFRLYAVSARFPRQLSRQIPWQEQQAGVYHCQWGTDVVRVVVARDLPREPHNAPLHLFSASPQLVGFGRGTYRQRSERTSRMLRQLLERYQGENVVMPFTVEDFDNWYTKEHFAQLTPEEQREALENLSPERRRECLKALLEGISAEEIRQYLEPMATGRAAPPRKPKRKK